MSTPIYRRVLKGARFTVRTMDGAAFRGGNAPGAGLYLDKECIFISDAELRRMGYVFREPKPPAVTNGHNKGE
jgi:hypothetical protein